MGSSTTSPLAPPYDSRVRAHMRHGPVFRPTRAYAVNHETVGALCFCEPECREIYAYV